MPTNDVPDEYLKLIGDIVTKFNHLDTLLTAVLMAAMGSDFYDLQSHIPFANLNFGVKQAMIDLTVKTMISNKSYAPFAGYDPMVEYGTGLRVRLDQVVAERNAISHSWWTFEDGIVKRHRIRAKRKIGFDRVTVSLEDLQSTVEKIESCRGKLSYLVVYIKAVKGCPQSGQKLNFSSNSSLDDSDK